MFQEFQVKINAKKIHRVFTFDDLIWLKWLDGLKIQQSQHHLLLEAFGLFFFGKKICSRKDNAVQRYITQTKNENKVCKIFLEFFVAAFIEDAHTIKNDLLLSFSPLRQATKKMTTWVLSFKFKNFFDERINLQKSTINNEMKQFSGIFRLYLSIKLHIRETWFDLLSIVSVENSAQIECIKIS